MLKKCGIHFLLPLSFLASTSLYAADNIHFHSLNSQLASLLASSFVMSLSVGPEFARGGETQTLQLGPELLKTYTANRPANTLGNIEIMLGIQRSLASGLQSQIGLAFATTSHANLSGSIWDDGLPQFDNYVYQYQIKHTQLALKGKLLADRGWPVIPWISLMLGMGINQASNFTNTPTIFEAIPSINFPEHTTTTLTYGFGIGMQRALSKSWQLGIGYEWVDWGKSALGSLPAPATSQTLSLSHFYASAVMVNLTFLANNG